MSGDIEDGRQCDSIQDELTELALGVLSGRRRSEVLGHVESCPRCNAELEQLSMVADTLLQLAPEVEPPLGFELRLAEKLQAGATVRRPRRHWRAPMLAGAAAVVALVGFGIGAFAVPGIHDNQAHSATANLASANLMSHGHVVGEVMVSAGNPAWLFMTVDRGSSSGPVTCALTLAGGRVETVGVFKLSDGYGAWGVPLTSSAGHVRSARLIAPNGAVLASARLSV